MTGTTNWLGLTSAAWQNDQNWDNGQPGSGDAALAVPPGAATLELRAHVGWLTYWVAPLSAPDLLASTA